MQLVVDVAARSQARDIAYLGGTVQILNWIAVTDCVDHCERGRAVRVLRCVLLRFTAVDSCRSVLSCFCDICQPQLIYSLGDA